MRANSSGEYTRKLLPSPDQEIRFCSAGVSTILHTDEAGQHCLSRTSERSNMGETHDQTLSREKQGQIHTSEEERM